MSERKGTKFFSTPSALRKRKPMNVTLSEGAHRQLDELAEHLGIPKSRVLEDAIELIHKQIFVEKTEETEKK